MTTSFTPKVVLVTGCSHGGIGFSLCEEYASRGCTVYASARRLEAMDAFKQDNIHKVVLDVTKEEDVLRVVKTIIEKEGRVDVLVNNAGTLSVGPVIDVPMDIIERTYDTNVFSIIRMCKAVIPHMAARKSGTIVNISSVGAYFATPWGGIYGSTKAATHSLSDVLYMECTPLNISVVLVATGSVRSNISTTQLAAFPGLPEDSLYKRFLPDMLARISMSQEMDTMPTEVYARKVVGQSLKARPPRYLLLGGKTWTYALLKWLPRTAVLWLFWRMFSKIGRAAA
ncbi:oxidoreductase [Epithele typhae]|uniref:oxidoreductase n=1 Tax=Epithele typhae TaxID=378194 RepID=UPI0020078C33|nr:oxidoreductase [Epithele typhae]KAH9920523.1 oxidoreductase [Epithele typhae]